MEIVKGNDISISWRIYRIVDGVKVPENLTTVTDFQTLVTANGLNVPITNSTISDTNLITILIKGRDQITGIYALEASWTSSLGEDSRVAYGKAFTVVDKQCQADYTLPEGLDVVSLEFYSSTHFGALYENLDVQKDDVAQQVKGALNGNVLTFDSSLGKWLGKPIVTYNRLDSWIDYTIDKAGYVLSAKLGYDLYQNKTDKTYVDNLIDNLYRNKADKTYVDDLIDGLSTSTHTHNNKTNVLDLLNEGHLEVLSKLSLVDGRLQISVDAYSLGELSAYGEGTGGGGGGSSSLAELVDVNVTGVATNDLLTYNGTHWIPVTRSAVGTPVSWGTTSGGYSPLTIGGVSKTVALNGHTHPFSTLSGIPTTILGYGITDAVNISLLNAHINDEGAAKHLTQAQLTGLINLINWWKLDGSGNLYTDLNVYSTKEVSAYGLGSGGSSGGGVDLLQAWTDYDSTKDNWAVKAGLLVPFYNDATSRLSALEGGAALSLSTAGTGNGVANITKSGTVLTVTKSNFAELDVNGKVLSSQLPSYVDDVLEYVNLAAFPTTGETGKIYIAQDTNKTYRWSGTAYTEISASLALGETSSTAYRGDRGKTAYDHSQAEHQTIINGTGFVKANGKTLSYDNNSYSLASHNHSGVYEPVLGNPSANGYLLSSTTAGARSWVAPYSLPTASASVLGGVKIGANVSIASGVISVHNPLTIGTANGLSLSTQVLSLALATTAANGALSSTDKTYIELLKTFFEYDSTNNAIKALKSFYSTGEISAYGLGTGGSGGGSYDRLDAWADYNSTKSGWVLSAFLGNELNTRVGNLEGGSALTVNTTGAGNAVTAISKSGTTITATKGLTFMQTSHAANAITSTNISNWNTAYGWGNHAGLYAPLSHVSLTNNPHNVTASQVGALSLGGGDIKRTFAGWPNAIDSDASNYINQRIFGVSTNQNTLSFFGDGNQNARRFGIQSGHESPVFATAFGILELNPFGGVVRINGATAATVNSNVASATKLQTARTIAGISFDGTANIAIPFANLSSIPTTISGYGLTDAVTINTVQTITAQKTFNDGDAVYGLAARPSIIVGDGGTTKAGAIRLNGNNSGYYASIQATTTALHIDMSNGTTAGNIYLGYYSGSNIGLGITPTEKLDVLGNIRLSGGTEGRYITLTNSGALRFTAGTGGWASSLSYNLSDDTALGSAAGAYGSATAINYFFYGGTYNAPSMVILPNGRVGIGLTTPGYNLGVQGTIGSTGNITAGGNFIITPSTASGDALQYGSVKVLRFNNNFTNGSTVLSTVASGIIYLRPNGDGSATGQLTVHNSGTVTANGNVVATGEITAYVASDRRLKENIKPIISALDYINKLNPVSYNWNARAKELNPMKSDSLDYGLIAQEVENVLPNVVHGIFDDKYKSIDYIKLIPILIGAVKELKQEIKQLRK